MLENLKGLLKAVQLTCTNCGATIKEGETFTASMILPSEKDMLVGPLDKIIARTAKSVRCTRCE